MINGSFCIIQINEKYLFLKRKDNGLMDIPGGGFEVNEIDYTGVALREIEEEAGIKLERKKIQLCAVLGQKLKESISAAYGGVTKGLVFLHYSIIYTEPNTLPLIHIGDEHENYRLFTYEEVIANYKQFSSGPLWLFFTFLSFQQTKKLQEGLLYDRRIWQGKEYIVPKVAVS